MILLVNSVEIGILQLYDYSLYSRTTTTLWSYNYRVFDKLEAENREFEMLKMPYFRC